MKWSKSTPKDYDIRHRRRFLWFPLCIDGICRWLCWASVKEEYKEASFNWAAPWGWKAVEWEDLHETQGKHLDV